MSTFLSLFFSTQLIACQGSGPEVVDFNPTIKANDDKLSTDSLNLNTIYILSIELEYEEGTPYGSYTTNVSFEYNKEELSLSKFYYGLNDTLDYQMTPKKIKDIIDINIKIGKITKKVSFSCSDSSVDDRYIELDSGNSYAVPLGINKIQSINELSDFVSENSISNRYYPSLFLNGINFDTNFLIAYCYNGDETDYVISFQCCFMHNNQLYLDFYIESEMYMVFSVKTSLLWVSIPKEYSSMEVSLYVSRLYV